MKTWTQTLRELIRPHKQGEEIERDPEVTQSVAASNQVLDRNRVLVKELTALETALIKRGHR